MVRAASRRTDVRDLDAFPDEAGLGAHLAGAVAAALMERAPELLGEAPKIEQLTVLADKLPVRR